MELTVLIIAAVIAVGGAVAGVVWGRRRAERALAEMERHYARRAEEIGADADARVDRLRREAELTRARHEVRLAEDLLPALDALRQAALTGGGDDLEIARGVRMVLRQAEEAFARHGVEKVEPDEGEPFDPQLHEAIDVVEAEAAGEVAACHRVGWHRDGQVLRSALVVVTRAAIQIEAADAEEARPEPEEKADDEVEEARPENR